jgi:hypothetical protein
MARTPKAAKNHNLSQKLLCLQAEVIMIASRNIAGRLTSIFRPTGW